MARRHTRAQRRWTRACDKYRRQTITFPSEIVSLTVRDGLLVVTTIDGIVHLVHPARWLRREARR